MMKEVYILIKLVLKKNNMRIAFAASRNLSIEIIEWIYNNKTKFNIPIELEEQFQVVQMQLHKT